MKQILTSLAIIVLTVSHAQCLTEIETESVLFMKQEEKLAHDVYSLLYEQWGQRIFTNIAQSEAQHVATIDSLIAKFGLVDTSPSEPGRFTISALQSLYDELIAKGRLSLIDALLVGRFVEVTDIADLTEAIDASHDASVVTVFTSLRKGSENHLSAFTAKLEPLYTPLTEPKFDLQFDSYGHPTLTWSDDWTHETGFRIERREAPLAWQELETLSAGTTSYTDLTCNVGVTDFRVVVLSPYEAVASGAKSCLRPFAEYSLWANEVFGDASDPAARRSVDPDRDGISNVEEYAAGSHPRVPSRSAMTFVAMEDSQLILRTYRRANMADVSVRFMASTDLMTWKEPEFMTEAISTPGLGLEQLSCHMETTNAEKGFVRKETY